MHKALVPHFAQLIDAQNVERLRKIKAIVSTYVENDKKIKSNNPLKAGQNSIRVVEEVRRYLVFDAAASLQASKTWWYQNYYEFDVAEKLRELITLHAKQTRYIVTELLEQAFAEAAKLSSEEQDAFARWMLEELADEERWQKSFDKSADLLSRLADEALAEYHQKKRQK